MKPGIITGERVFFAKGFSNTTLTTEQMDKCKELADQNKLGYSFMIYDQEIVERLVLEWRQKLPWIDAFYAVKTNPHEFILKDIHKNGLGFDAASKGEIQQLLELGVDPTKIVYSNPVKEEGDLEFAYLHGVRLTTADSLQELEKISTIAPEMNVLWRITSVDSQIQSTSFGNKFGDDISTDEEAEEKFKEIANMGINLDGLHFHCGSALEGATKNFKHTIEKARRFIIIGRKCGHRMSIMDIGGGFPGHEIPQNMVDILSMTRNDPLNYRVIAEPGRHFATLCFNLMVRVIGQKTKGGMNCYHINDSVYHAFNNVATDGLSLDDLDDQFLCYLDDSGFYSKDFIRLQKSNIFGMTCCGHDVIAKNLSVPSDLKLQDWICFSGMGSYTYSMVSNFNSMKSSVNFYRFKNPPLQTQSLSDDIKSATQSLQDLVIESNKIVENQPIQLLSQQQQQKHAIMKSASDKPQIIEQSKYTQQQVEPESTIQASSLSQISEQEESFSITKQQQEEHAQAIRRYARNQFQKNSIHKVSSLA